MSLKWSDEAPGVGEYQELRRLSGLDRRAPATAAAALEGSLAAVAVRSGARLVAVARLVGDGGSHVQIVDVTVDPEFRGQGIATGLLERLMAWTEANLPSGCQVSAIADPGSFALLRRAGFEIRTGMVRTLP